MNLLLVFLLMLTNLSLTFALKSPSLCNEGKGNSFVCTVIANVNDKDSYPSQFSIDTDGITVAKYGQDNLFQALQSLSILSRSLRNQINEEIPNTQNRQWLRLLNTANERLSLVNYKTVNLYYTAVSSIKRFQSLLNYANSSNAESISATTAKATHGMQYESDRQLVLSFANVHYQEMKQCWNSFVNELESLQNKTRQSVEVYYDSTIDLLDQIGKCVESGPEAKCARDAHKKLTPLISLPVKFSLDAFKFTAIAEKKFEKYPCTLKAVIKFNTEIRKITRTAQTTTSPPDTTTTTKRAD